MELSMQAAGGLFLWIFPIFVLAGVLEGLIYQRLSHQPFDWRASAASLGVAIGHRLTGIVLGGVALSQFAWLHDHRLMDIPVNNVWSIVLLFFGSEFFYYWQHRFSHEIRWFWASHAVHHSPEQLNLSAAYRLGWTGAVSGMALLFAPLVLAGFSPQAVFVMLSLNLLYQFWLHTELVPRLGWFDGIFNSPSNHRVHHASNQHYLDKNYGGALVIFDRLFGTYVAENTETKIRYGLLGKSASYNPFVIALAEWAQIIKDVAQAQTWRDRWYFVFGRPGWKPASVKISASSIKSVAKQRNPSRQP